MRDVAILKYANCMLGVKYGAMPICKAEQELEPYWRYYTGIEKAAIFFVLFEHFKRLN